MAISSAVVFHEQPVEEPEKAPSPAPDRPCEEAPPAQPQPQPQPGPAEAPPAPCEEHSEPTSPEGPPATDNKRFAARPIYMACRLELRTQKVVCGVCQTVLKI